MGMEISDELLSAVVPVIVYWVFSFFYEFLAQHCVNYRLHPIGEEEEKNTVSRSKVIKGVLTHQALQILTVCIVTKVWEEKGEEPTVQHSLPRIAVQFVIGMAVIDTVQYFGHRYMHENKFLYKHTHSAHHALVVPYVYGAQYGSLLDGLVLDTMGSALAFVVSGMTVRTSIYFYSFAIIKNLDVHSGLYFPWNPLQGFFPNNCAFHDTHHQLKGQKYNFSQPFFLSWDLILGTYRPFTVEKRKEGGFQVCLLTKDD
ncbi:sphinganine C4-monooxygenase 1-like [Dioscorea cayenensis subsp. rotundata]|uniref:aldehyde oxygenase (deformylating) n=1 Tax=Dioscorea cayennensis subsp. rotundata TaxID=55577 RepID=A0AB40ALB6_DIOCR|nr:sphinganine C4-monooxygenase 1-like [Dioscorea cayenensis subsp. rotundata]